MTNAGFDISTVILFACLGDTTCTSCDVGHYFIKDLDIVFLIYHKNM